MKKTRKKSTTPRKPKSEADASTGNLVVGKTVNTSDVQFLHTARESMWRDVIKKVLELPAGKTHTIAVPPVPPGSKRDKAEHAENYRNRVGTIIYQKVKKERDDVRYRVRLTHDRTAVGIECLEVAS